MDEQVVLEEEIDPNYEPTQAEIEEYAAWLGMVRGCVTGASLPAVGALILSSAAVVPRTYKRTMTCSGSRRKVSRRLCHPIGSLANHLKAKYTTSTSQTVTG
eukprot:SAG31_NODE_10003_length_1198_cov_1.017288_1_plen_101_part_10